LRDGQLRCVRAHSQRRRLVVEDDREPVRAQQHDPDVGCPHGLGRHAEVGELFEEVVLRGRLGPVHQLVVEAVLQLLAHRDVGADRHQQDGEADRHGREQGDPTRQRAPVVPALSVGLGLLGDRRGHDSLST
jgi:hypothetical protein